MWIGRVDPRKLSLPTPEQALPGRDVPLWVAPRHRVLDAPLREPFPEGLSRIQLGMGCFWGAERKFWHLPGVYSTAVGYAGGYTPNPTYEEVCSGRTGHTEVVLVVWDEARVSLDEVLRTFWENHDPTQGMRQGNDVGTQYRSFVACSDADQRAAVERSRDRFQQALTQAGHGTITTELRDWVPFFHAEDDHQQYLDKHPNGYCGLGGLGVGCPSGLTPAG